MSEAPHRAPHRAPGGGARTVPVWDAGVRLFHWSLVALIALAWLTDDGPKRVHEPAGYAVAALLGFRLVWGIVGPRRARFADFVRGPRATLRYLAALRAGEEPRFLGHNPAGGAMIVALLATIAATALTGWLQTTDRFWGSTAMEEIHGACATAILLLVALHLGGVVFESWRHRENLVAAMIDGRKRP